MLENGSRYTGFWWHPEHVEKKYYGTLVIYEDESVLELLFTPEQILGKEDKEFIGYFINNEIPVIHGRCGGLQENGFSLLGGYITGQTSTGFNTFIGGILPITVTSVYQNILITRIDEPFIREAIVKTSYLNEWIPPLYFDQTYDDPQKIKKISYSTEKKEIFVFENDMVKISYNSYFSGSVTSGNDFSYKIYNDASIDIKSDRKLAIQEFKKYLSCANTFVTICSGNISAITDVRFLYKDENISEIPSTCWLKHRKDETRHHEPIISFDSINDIQTVFGKWQIFLFANMDCMNMLFDILQSPKTFFPDRKCENFVQIFENLMKQQYGEKVTIKRVDYNYFVDDKKKINPSDIVSNKYLVSKFIYIFLEQKKDVFDNDFSETFQSNSIETKIQFIKDCKNIRNKYSHGGKEIESVIYAPSMLNVILLKAIRVLLLNDILGLTDVKIPLEQI
jgi:hypothetical protein